MRIAAKAFAKINWSLDILSAREDGYHEMDMLMQRISLHDEIVFSSARNLSLSINGRLVPWGGKNLVVRAASALSQMAGRPMGARIEMTKRIPVRAGLGGGSADCAVALMALNRLWNLGLNARELMQVGAGLGADVPFCMEGRFCRVQGIGERMQHLSAAPQIDLVLCMPAEGLSTAGVFAEYDARPRSPLRLDMEGLSCALRYKDLPAARALAGNALEQPAMDLLPEIRGLIERMYDCGAEFAHMTGSGSCVFGAFSSPEAGRRAAAQIPGAMLAQTLGNA